MSFMNRRAFLRSGAAAAAGLSMAPTGAGAKTQDVRGTSLTPIVPTTEGRVQGRIRNGVHQFWGVPYGASTGGSNRFMPPVRAAAWSGVRDAIGVGNRAPQDSGGPVSVVWALDRREPMGEDCLNINIFTPGPDNGRRPVMVWLHGGGFSGGSGNWLLYDGTNLAWKEDVVVVAVNHRLNLFGFLHLADLGGEKWARSTNVGVQDIVAVLDWIRDNIAEFGGDPERVTIFGQSGGGGKVTTLMAMPSAEGLFHGGIAMSGSALRGTPRDGATEAAERFLSRLGLGPDRLDALQSMPWRQLQEAFHGEPAIPGLARGPVIDGSVIPRHQWDPTAPEYSVDVPLMMGSTETENGWVGPPPLELSDGETLARFIGLANDDAAAGRELMALYRRKHPDRVNQMLWLTAQSDDTRRRNAQTLGELKFAQGGAPSFLYFFDWYSPVYDNRMGSYHTLDIPFALYNVDIAASMTGAMQARYELAHKMSAAWAAFARNGDPNHADIPDWPAFDPADYPTMMFGDDVRMVRDPNREERLALAALRAG